MHLQSKLLSMSRAHLYTNTRTHLHTGTHLHTRDTATTPRTHLHTTPEQCVCDLNSVCVVCVSWTKNCASVCEWNSSLWCSVCGLKSVCDGNWSVMCGV